MPEDREATVASVTQAAANLAAQLSASAEAGRRSFLDDYGATNEAELFAVATEAYFLRPDKLRRHEPALHALLAGFYRVEL